MESSEPGWWRKHGWTAALLLTSFGIALLIRSIWMAPIIEQFGALNVYGGGSDSFYHSRVMTYIIQNHRNLVQRHAPATTRSRRSTRGSRCSTG